MCRSVFIYRDDANLSLDLEFNVGVLRGRHDVLSSMMGDNKCYERMLHKYIETLQIFWQW
jgi:hypothetical protein